MSLKQKLEKSLNEKDVENIYRAEFAKTDGDRVWRLFAADLYMHIGGNIPQL